MSDFLAGLNGPAPEPKPEFDDTLLFQTTDFLNFDLDTNTFEAPASWNEFSFNDINIPGDAHSKLSTSTFTLPEVALGGAQTPTSTSSRRKTLTLDDPSLNFEDHTRMAAEEDKRRRNTAASARFRVKKKQKEQALEKHAKDMQDKLSKLEKRVAELDTENKWLKGLLTDQPDSEADKFSELFAKYKNSRSIEADSDSA